MLSSLRARLIVICVLIVAVAMIVLSAANIYTVRSDTLEAISSETQQLTESHAANITEWVRSKRTITGAMKQARCAMGRLAIDEVLRFLGGQPLRHEVTREMLPTQA